jgi:hypothetical protein
VRWQRFPRERVEIRVAEEPDGEDLVLERRERGGRRWPVGVLVSGCVPARRRGETVEPLVASVDGISGVWFSFVKV